VNPTPDPHAFHAELMRFNATRLTPGRIHSDWARELRAELAMRTAEGYFVEIERARIAAEAERAPADAPGFVRWFEGLRERGPGQGDRLFPWLASCASMEQMRWFLTQEAAGEAGFDDLVAMTQVKLAPVRAKLEMARNYWDEMGRGHERGMHGLMLHAVVEALRLEPAPERTVWESLALANLMVALAANRRYAYQAVGALGVIEMTAPGRVALVNEGLKRLGVATEARLYFQLHSELDVKHSRAWNGEVLHSLVEADPGLARPIAEGALMRLACGARCFERYRSHFGLDASG
jgi:heme oxygenase-like protein